MKYTLRIVSLLLVLLFSILTFASAETIDISGLSYDELVALKKQINLAIMQSKEWKEVTVPVGKYIVGTDIPAGDYTVTYNDSFQAAICIFSGDGKLLSYDSLGELWRSSKIGKLTLLDGQTLGIEYGEVIFTPYTGLGF